MLLELALYAISITPIVVFIAMMWLRAGDLLAGKVVIIAMMIVVLVFTVYFIEWSANDPNSLSYKKFFAATVIATSLVGLGANKYNKRKYGIQPASAVVPWKAEQR